MIDRPHNIYRITCDLTGKSYVGITCRKVSVRWSAHISASQSPDQRRCRAILRAIKTYGQEAFKVEVLAVAVNGREASAIERGLIAQYGTMHPCGYNLTSGGEIGKKPSSKTRKLMSASAKARGTYVRTEESRKRSSLARLEIMTDEMRRKIGDFHRGKVMSPETRAKISATKLGSNIRYPKGRKSRAHAPD